MTQQKITWHVLHPKFKTWDSYSLFMQARAEQKRLFAKYGVKPEMKKVLVK